MQTPQEIITPQTVSYHLVLTLQAIRTPPTDRNIPTPPYQHSTKSALYYNKANSRSTAIGYAAMFDADDRTTGRETFNTALGYEALKGNISTSANTGQYNTALGDQAMYSNTSGSENAAFGRMALYSNTIGSLNNAIGDLALSSNTTGDFNSACGTGAMLYNTAGSNNTAEGYLARKTIPPAITTLPSEFRL